MLILNADDVRRALPMADAIDAMKRAFAALTLGQALVPPRIHMHIKPHDGITLVMPGYVGGDDEALAVKVVSLFPGNVARGLRFIQAAVVVFEPDTGRPAAMLEGATLTAIRTGAAQGAATDFMARRDSRTVALLGAGVQARTQLEAACAVRDIESVRVYAPTRGHVEGLIKDMAGVGRVPREVRIASSTADAVRGADIVLCATTAKTPIFDDADIKPGAHVAACGSYQPHVRELPAETVVRSRVVVDSYKDAREEAGDLIQPIEAGLIDWSHVRAELGELALGQRKGREADDEVTLFKSVGVAVQDAFAAAAAMKRAAEHGLGQRVAF